MNLYFVYIINIRFICDGEIYLLTYLLNFHSLTIYFSKYKIELITCPSTKPKQNTCSADKVTNLHQTLQKK